MLPLIAGGLMLGSKLLDKAQAKKDARQQALDQLVQNYTSGGGYTVPQMPQDEGPSALSSLAGAGLSAWDQADANTAAAKAGQEEPGFGTGLRRFVQGRMR